MDSSTLPAAFLPPVNRSMKVLDRSFFRKTVLLAAASVSDAKQISEVRKAIVKSDGAPLPKFLRDDPDQPGTKCLLLHPRLKQDDPSTWSTALRTLSESGLVKVRNYKLELGYDDWTMHSILEAIIPEMLDDEQELPTGFAQVGHVAHLNLRSQYLPYKYLIGQVLMDKNPQIQTVINKTLDVGTESVFRTFPYEVLAGEDNLDVTVSESGCEFQFNFGKVYWNSRLGTEHGRIIDKFSEGEAVCDVMAGVGPFAVPAGKRNIFVHANDLNPDSFAGLQAAIKRNKVGDFVSPSCEDGRAFIRKSAELLQSKSRSVAVKPKLKISRNSSSAEKQAIQKKIEEGTKLLREPKSFDHYVMNLPATAIEFLDAFKGLLQGREAEFSPHTERHLPLIHVHLFQAKHTTIPEEHDGVLLRLAEHLGHDLSPAYKRGEVELFDVRLVAPNKRMYCATFRLPAAVAFADTPPS
ncbi:uncharacterized protein HMPREF1541_08339 [Cyphellophora europaea CBS 101466]|uniref:tRNA (guanine(37)-N1)-methyltransferase n=1 Tax=Cyphellophora europaea (strain CBS 101466) TaxID=1220924 RepID=W2RNS8_CYPE1|nr:uncharacterized protein HMPREF1541_08339 [Cyphellophora europaea CBS 101466]ETN37348.1 hypothetical protein HMPREF1541_08339 [Cyphellophora europaea CBS 101466]